MKIKKFTLIVLLFSFAATNTYAYNNLRITGSNTFDGECNNGRSFSGTYVESLGSYSVNGPEGSFSVVGSRDKAIKQACGE